VCAAHRRRSERALRVHPSPSVHAANLARYAARIKRGGRFRPCKIPIIERGESDEWRHLPIRLSRKVFRLLSLSVGLRQEAEVARKARARRRTLGSTVATRIEFRKTPSKKGAQSRQIAIIGVYYTGKTDHSIQIL
jgi:hypothetical protein